MFGGEKLTIGCGEFPIISYFAGNSVGKVDQGRLYKDLVSLLSYLLPLLHVIRLVLLAQCQKVCIIDI